jgi:hypothetical protein
MGQGDLKVDRCPGSLTFRNSSSDPLILDRRGNPILPLQDVPPSFSLGVAAGADDAAESLLRNS